MYGVSAFSGEPTLSFVPDEALQIMFRSGLTRSAREAKKAR